MKHTWDCVIQRDDGQMFQRQVTAGWTPEKDFVTGDSIARTACGEAFAASDKQHRFMPISAQLVE